MACMAAALLLFVAGSRHVSSEYGSLPDFASLCPYNKMCNSIPTKTINESYLMPCCQKCSCANDCHLVGNCCPDVITKNVTEPVYPCVSIDLIFNKVRGLRLRAYDNLQFRVIDTCPDSHRDEVYPACKSPVDLKDYIIVSDISGEKVYKNRQCAMCHGILDYIVWDFYTTCKEIVTKHFETLEDKNRYLLKDCPFFSLPPRHSRILETTRCYKEYMIFNKCRYNDVSDKLKKACETKRPVQNTKFFVRTSTERPEIFANVYCYLCNLQGGSSVIDVCSSEAILPSRFLSKVPFTALLNLDADETKPEITQCRSMDIWDPFDNVCRQLLCQSGNIPFYGKCVESIAYSMGYAMPVWFGVDTNNRTEANSRLINFLIKKLYRFGGRNMYCKMCDSTIYRSENISEYLFKWPLSTTEKCSREQLLSFVEKLERKGEIQLQYESDERPVNISVKVSFNKPKVKVVADISRGVTPCSSELQIDRITLQNCPRIELSTEEASVLHMSHQSLNKKFKWRLIKNRLTNKTSICVDNYFQLRRLAKNGQSNFHIPKLLLIVANVSLLLRTMLMSDLM